MCLKWPFKDLSITALISMTSQCVDDTHKFQLQSSLTNLLKATKGFWRENSRMKASVQAFGRQSYLA